jgi:hypothetical protein
VRRAAALTAASVLAACGPSGGGGADPGTVGLAPTFPSVTTAVPTTSPGAAPVTPATEAPVAGGAGPVEPAGAPAPVLPGPTGAPLAATVVDREGDATPFVGGAPPWADIVQGRLFRHDDGFELRVALGGGSAPTGSGSAERTMNLASFYDLDGDGTIDVEVWANLADGGWDRSYFDNDEGRADFGGASGVTVEVDGAEVVLRFPLDHLDGAGAFRWSLASEYASYETIGTLLAARDDAPDGDDPAPFPG